MVMNAILQKRDLKPRLDAVNFSDESMAYDNMLTTLGQN